MKFAGSFFRGGAASAAPAVASTGRPSRGTVLVAEDDESLRMTLRFVLTRHDYNVVSVENGRRACEAIGRVRPDLVMLDWDMPEMDGPTAALRIKSDAASQRVPIVLMTAGGAERLGTARTLGVDDFLSKPFETAGLLALVNARVRRTTGDAAGFATSYDRLAW